MEELVQKFQLMVKKMRGKDEFEMYRNYVYDLPFPSLAVCLFFLFESGRLKLKSNLKAQHIREQGNNQFKIKKYELSLYLYTKSLRYANYNGREYAVALANRSAVYFDLEDYKSSIDDINLSLQAKYPKHLKPKVYIRKAKCYQKLGKAIDMRNTLTDLLEYLDGSTGVINLSKIEKYKAIVKELITAPVENKPISKDIFAVLPTMNSNSKFMNASSSVMLQFNKRKGRHVVAKTEIKRGDVLFVEQAYAVAPAPSESVLKEYTPTYCQYCFSKITSCVPCKNCVKHLYCNETCRDTAWKEFHQWECVAVQAGFFRISCPEVHLAFRICMKAVLSGVSTDTINFEKGIATYGNKDNNYPYVYNLPSYTTKMKKNQLMEYAAFSALLVHYLKGKTTFFDWMQQLPSYANKSHKDLMTKVGGLILKHCTQFHRSIVPIRVFDDQRIPDMLPIALSVCPSIAMMGHSCMANTTTYFVGNTAVVKATQDIKINEEVFCTWGDFTFNAYDKEIRQTVLQELYCMKCSCDLCNDPKRDKRNSYLCINCNGPAPLIGNFLFPMSKCLYCNTSFMLPMELAVKERLAYSFLRRFADLENIQDANRCLELSKAIFRPEHTIFERLYQELLQYYKRRGQIECFVKISKILLDYFERDYSGFSLVMGLMCYTACIDMIDIFNAIALNMNIKLFGEMLEELTTRMEKAKVVFALHYPEFGARLQQMEKSIFDLRILHTLQIAKKLNN